MTIVVPAILTKTEEEFKEKLHRQDLRKLADLYQIDILDGSLYGATCWADPNAISGMQPLPKLELHLMVNDPLPVIETWSAILPEVTRVIVHAEITQPLDHIISKTKTLGLEIGIALNPETSLEMIEQVSSEIDLLLIMGVHPGASGQAFLGEKVIEKIKTAKSLYPNLRIAIDGGVTIENVKQMIEAGVSQLCASSAIWKAEDPASAFLALQNS